jgi:hypothetical protein
MATAGRRLWRSAPPSPLSYAGGPPAGHERGAVFLTGDAVGPMSGLYVIAMGHPGDPVAPFMGTGTKTYTN